MNDTLNKAIEIIVNFVKPEKIILFGSRARGDFNNDSDYDLLILKKNLTNKRIISKKLHYKFIELSAPFDILLYDYNKYNESIQNKFQIYSKVDKEGVVLYEK